MRRTTCRSTQMSFSKTSASRSFPGAKLLKELREPLESLRESLAAYTRAIADSLVSFEQERLSVQERWAQEREGPVNEEFEEILREIQEDHVDVEAYIELRNEVEKLRPVEKTLETLETERSHLFASRQELAKQWSELLAARFRALEKAAKQVNKKLKLSVRVTVTHSGDKRPLFDILRETVSGRLKEAEDNLEAYVDFSLEEFGADCRTGADALVTRYGLTSHQATQIVEQGEDLFMRIEEIELPDVTDVALNVSSDRRRAEWRSMERLSSGQKATAALLLLFLEADAPLLVDQPEDDLDNSFIADGIVPKLRAEKRRRQFLVSSHNANLPVLGDAELIIGMTAEGEAEGGSAEIPEHWLGSIDCPGIQTLVETVLEGGKRAFETRRRKYGF